MNLSNIFVKDSCSNLKNLHQIGFLENCVAQLRTLDGKTVNYWLSAGENSWPSVQVVIVTERLFSSSFISINGGNKIPFFNINVSGNTY